MVVGKRREETCNLYHCVGAASLEPVAGKPELYANQQHAFQHSQVSVCDARVIGRAREFNRVLMGSEIAKAVQVGPKHH